MQIRRILLEQIRRLLVPADRLIVIHSSLPHLGARAADVKWHLLYALRVLTDEGHTIALPAFTFSFCRGRPFDLSRSPSETGVLADWARESFPDAHRTPHPIYSFVVLGPLAERVCACPSTTTFGDDSPFALFEELDARIVVLGCDWRYCTQCHRYEEKANVPYRYFKTFVAPADFGAGTIESCAKMFVRDLDINPVNDFSPAIQKLRQAHAVRTEVVLEGIGESASCRELATACMDFLESDPWAFVVDGKVTSYRAEKLRTAAKQPSFRVAILGNANYALLQKALTERFRDSVADCTIEVYTPPFGQMAQEILGSGSRLTSFQPDLTIFADRLEDLLGVFTINEAEPAAVEQKVRAYAELVRRHHEAQSVWTVVHAFAPLSRSASGAADCTRESGSVATLARADMVLREGLSNLRQLHLFDTAREAALFAGLVVDPRLWFLGRFPYSEPFSHCLAKRWTALALAATGRSIRLIILDLDNTLWGGVLGEDGVSGVQIGGDFPGNAYAAFQDALKRLSARGVALAIASKNDAAAALAAMDSLPAMLIRTTDIVAHRINWEPKWRNVEAICADLALGTESVLFIDDNPVEREQIRRNLPGVKVLDLPSDPALYSQALLDCPWIEAITLTHEDFVRVEGYRARGQIIRSRESAANLEDFLASLGMKVYLQPLDQGNTARAAQLAAKTNQFNATTRRYTQRQLEELAASSADVVVIGLEDTCTHFENIGLMILRPEHRDRRWLAIDTYLLSCRVLGRGLETAMVRWVVETAGRRGHVGVVGEVIETERNAPVRSIYADVGFEADGRPGLWRLAVADADRTVPLCAWLTIVDCINSDY